MPEAKVPTGAIILVSLVLAGLAYLVWTYVSRDDDPPAAQLSESAEMPVAETGSAQPGTALTGGLLTQPGAVQTQVAPPTTAALDATGGPSAAASGQAGRDAAGGGGSAGAADGGDAGSAETPALAAAGQEQAGESAASGAATGGVGAVLFTEAASSSQPTDLAAGSGAAEPAVGGPRVVLKATQDSWVQIRNASNASIFTRVLRAGDVYEVPDEAGLTLLTGNAGGLEITVDGEAIPKPRSLRPGPPQRLAQPGVSEGRLVPDRACKPLRRQPRFCESRRQAPAGLELARLRQHLA